MIAQFSTPLEITLFKEKKGINMLSIKQQRDSIGRKQMKFYSMDAPKLLPPLLLHSRQLWAIFGSHSVLAWLKAAFSTKP